MIGMREVWKRLRTPPNAPRTTTAYLNSRGLYAPVPPTANVADSDIVHICINTIATGLLSGQLVVDNDGELEFDNPLAQAIRVDGMAYSLFLQQIVRDMVITGNAYMLFVKAGARSSDIQSLYPLTARYVQPFVNGNTMYYRYMAPFAVQPKDAYTQDEVLHIKYNLSPESPFFGVTPLQYVIGELSLDMVIRQFQNDVMINLGYPGFILNKGLKEGESQTEADDIAKETKAIIDMMRGREAGAPLVLIGDWSAVDPLPSLQNKIDVRSLRYLPEERVCASVRVPTDIAGLGAGTERIGTNATIIESHRQFYTDCIIPFSRLIAEQLTEQILRRYEDNPRVKFVFDFSEVEALKENYNDRVTRLISLYDTGIITREEVRVFADFTEEPEYGEFDKPAPEPAVAVADTPPEFDNDTAGETTVDE